MTTEPHKSLRQTRQVHHPLCIVCGNVNGKGLGLQFDTPRPGVVEACFPCPSALQGYEGILHGGVSSALLDGAMTNCLFAMGRPAVTAEMRIRFRHPVQTGCPVLVRAWLESSHGILHLVTAELRQNDRVMVTASGKFVDKPLMSKPS